MFKQTQQTKANRHRQTHWLVSLYTVVVTVVTVTKSVPVVLYMYNVLYNGVYCPVGRCRVTGNLYLPMSLSRPHPPIACRMHTSTCTHLHFTRLHTHLHDKVVVYIQFSVSVHSRGCSCYSGLHYTLTIVRNVKAQSVRTVYIQCTTTTAEIKYKKTLPANLEKYVIVQWSFAWWW